MTTICSYFNPCSQNFHAIEDFQALSCEKKTGIGFITTLFACTLILIPLVVPVFRYLVGRCTAKPVPTSTIEKTQTALITKSPQFNGREERSVAQMYNEDDLGACTLFAGNFINFGFWEQPMQTGTISKAQRIESGKNMYRFVVEKLAVTEQDKLLEVACGQGVGCALVLTEFNPRELHGLDFSQAQISRAKKVNSETLQKNPDKIFFQEGSAENMPYESGSFKSLYSIEAAQHFKDLGKFTSEAHRVLKPGGKLAIASFFGTSDKSHKPLSTMIQTIRDGIDKATPIYTLEEMLKKNGFKNIKIESIGENVWHGYDQWTAQGDFRASWTRNWYNGYQQGLIDYYLITAEKPT